MNCVTSSLQSGRLAIQYKHGKSAITAWSKDAKSYDFSVLLEGKMERLGQCNDNGHTCTWMTDAGPVA